MPELILGPMLRFASATEATVWVETDQRCVVEVLGRIASTFCVAGHHYALVMIDGLAPGSVHEYDVRLDGAVRWPLPGSSLPPSRIRTVGGSATARIVFGSCRTAAPHEPPWTLQLEFDWRGRGVDALYVYARSMLDKPHDEWPELAVFIGDQIYADDSSPRARERIAKLREASGNDAALPPPELVGGFEQYTWLYHESWGSEMERWFFANVPSVMVFDDHEVVDDWNISAAWIDDIQHLPWWRDHIDGGLMTYWLYQHLGNLSPDVIRSEGLLDALQAVDDGEVLLREWADRADMYTADSTPYRFSFVRDVGSVRLVVVDCRNVRVLEPGKRRMVDSEEWAWVVEACRADVDHLLIGTSLPVFVPIGLHDLQVWSEVVCDGRWGRIGRKAGEWLRIKADMEDWAAFGRSFDDFCELLTGLAATRDGSVAPSTISVLSGDIHFSYAAEVRFPAGEHAGRSRVHQLVSSPIRNALKPPESTAMRLGTSVLARSLGRLLRRAAGRRRPPLQWDVDLGPVFANSLAELTFDERSGRLLVLQARPHAEGQDDAQSQFDRAFELDLVAGSRATALGGGAERTWSSRRPRRRQTRYRPRTR